LLDIKAILQGTTGRVKNKEEIRQVTGFKVE
jgi:hypothetical protein